MDTSSNNKSIKPIVNFEDVKKTALKVYGFTCETIREINGYDDRNFHIKIKQLVTIGGETNEEKVHKDGYVLKIINLLDSKKPEYIEAQNKMLLFLRERNINCSEPVKTIDGKYYAIETYSSGKHIVRLLKFIPGNILHTVPCTNKLFYQCGEYVANLDNALKDFYDPVYETHTSLWMIDSVPELHNFLNVIEDENKINIVENVIEEFKRRVVAIRDDLEKGMIHGDFNEQNVIVESVGNEFKIKAVLDFGDSQYSCYLYELAITMCYMIIQGKSLDAGGFVLGGFRKVRNVPESEFKLLKVCIAARLCQSLVLGAYFSAQQPDNPYILTTAKTGWALLQELWHYPEDELLNKWNDISARKTDKF